MLPGFLDEFFPEETHGPDTFSLLHYNGLVRSGGPEPGFVKGEAVILEGVAESGQLVAEILPNKFFYTLAVVCFGEQYWRHAPERLDGPTAELSVGELGFNLY